MLENVCWKDRKARGLCGTSWRYDKKFVLELQCNALDLIFGE